MIFASRRSEQCILKSLEKLNGPEAGTRSKSVGKNVTHKASNLQKVQLLSTNGPQQVQ
jgi:hypothetical protein